MTACTPKEEMEWRTRLGGATRNDGDRKDSNLYSSLSLNIKSLGTVFGKPGKHRYLSGLPFASLCRFLTVHT